MSAGGVGVLPGRELKNWGLNLEGIVCKVHHPRARTHFLGGRVVCYSKFE